MGIVTTARWQSLCADDCWVDVESVLGGLRFWQTGIAREPDLDVLCWQGLLSRLIKLIGMAARIASACAAMLRVILAMVGGVIDVMTCRNGTADG
jgi:hypothetical protein